MLPKKVTKSRTGSKGFHSKVISLNQNFKPKFNVVFFFADKFSCSDNITARNNKTKRYKKLHLRRCSGCLSTGVACILVRGGPKSDIMDFLYEP